MAMLPLRTIIVCLAACLWASCAMPLAAQRYASETLPAPSQPILGSPQGPGVVDPSPAPAPASGPAMSAPSRPSSETMPAPSPGPGSWAEEIAAPPGPYDSLMELMRPGVTPETLADSIDVTPPPVYDWYQPAYWFGPTPWDAGVQLGINGSESNNSVFSMRTGGHLNRESDRWKLKSSLNYNKTVTNGIETQNNGVHDLRLDRILAATKWTLFVLENFIYDEFKTYDVQLSLNSGVGYQWIKTDTTDLLTRLGVGTLREFGGVENDWQPTALAGFDFTRQITKMQRLTAKVDYFPEWEDFSNYRVLADFGWEIQLDQPKNMSLKVSAIDRYDSSPDGSTPNALDYAVMLIWGL
jgi:putative salt-induced outer membrane protein YdiY